MTAATAANPVSLSVSGNGAVDEGDPALTVTATLGAANTTGQALAIPVQLRASGTTASPGDYTLAGTISIAAGALSGETDFEVVDDSDVEALESVVVGLGSALPSGLLAGTPDHVTIELGDNDAPVNACLSGAVLQDVQGYAQETANGAAHVTRWKQALAGFGARNGETEMTAATAKQHAEDFSASRWNPAVTALRCLNGPEVTVAGGGGITEGGDAAFTVTAAPAVAWDVTVTLAIGDDTVSDFLGTSDEGEKTVTIPANQPSATLTVSTENDSANEANGSVSARLVDKPGYTVGDPGAASVAVADDDAAAVPSISLSAGAAIAEGGDAVFTVTADPAPSSDLDVTLDIEDDAASDFLAEGDEGSHTVTIPAGQPSATLTLTTVGDSADEANGVVTATVAAGTGYTAAAPPGDTASVAVADDDATTVVLSTPDTTATEGSMTQMAEVTLTLGRGLVDGETLVAPLQFKGAAPGTDFMLYCPDTLPEGVSCQNLAPGDTNPQVTFEGPGSGESDKTVTISLAAQEDNGAINETVTVSIPASSSGGAPVLGATGLGGGATGSRTGAGRLAITDNDTTVRNACVPQSLKNRVYGYRNANRDAGKTESARKWQRVLIAFGAEQDAGLTSYTVADALAGEAVWFGWKPVREALQCLEGREVTVAGGSDITEGGDAVFTVTAAPARDWPMTVTLEIGDDGASDFLAGSDEGEKTVTIPANQPSATLTLSTVGDSTDEADGSVTATVVDKVIYAVGDPGTASVAVSDDDGAAVPAIRLSAGAAVTEGGDAVFTVTATPAPTANLDVTLEVADAANSDFLGTNEEGSHTVTIPANQPSATLTLSTVGDSTDEANGVVTATVAAGTGYSVAAPPDDTASVAVADDDATSVTLSTPDTSAAEGDASDTAEIVLTLGRGLVDGETLVAPLQFTGGAAGTLFTLACPSPLPTGVTCQTLDSAPQVTFAGPSSGVSTVAVTLSFTARDDADSDGETVTVSIPASSTGNAPVLTATGLGGGATGSRSGDGQIAIADNDAPAQTNPVSLSVSGNGAVDEGDPALTVTATLGTANATGQALAIPIEVRTAGTTASSGDYTLAGTISIADGALSGETDFEAVDDGDVEALESVVVELGSALPSGIAAGTPDHVTIEVGDNDAPVNACLSGAVLSDVQDYAQETGNGAAHVTRWKQALAGFGARNGETEMDAATAQDHADDFWAVRWNPVVTALQCLENAANTEPGIAVTGGSGITEGGDVVFTVTADPAPTANLAVTLDIEDAANSDFLGTSDEGSQTVTILANQNSATLTLSTVGDTTDEANGVVTASVQTGTGYTVAVAPDDTASVAVADDDATTVVLSTPDTGAAEGDAAEVAEIVLTLGRGLVDGESLVAPLQFAGGAAGTLFTLTCPNPLPTGVTCQSLDSAPQVTFAGPSSGVSTVAVTLSFTARDDADSDGETVTVSIPASSTGNAPVLTATGLGGGATGSRSGNGEIAIADDDAAESDACYADVKPDVKTYALETSNGTAHVTRWERVLAAFGEDNGKTPMTVAEAQQNADDFWAVRWDPVVTALQCLENAGTTGTNTEPEIAVTGGSAVTEGGDAEFTVTADPAPTADLAVTLDIEDDATSDFLDDSDEGSHTVTIPANQPSATLTLATVNDSTDEADGSVTASVRTGTGYTVAASPDDTASVAVNDDDTPAVPTLSVAIAPASATEGDTGKSWATVTFGLDPVRAQPTSFKACLAGTASAGEDYRLVGSGDETPLSLTGGCHSYTLAANAASGEARLMIPGDTAFEPDETVTVELRDPPQGAAVSGGAGTAAHTIVNDDPELAGCVDNTLRATVQGYAGDTGESRQYRDRWERVLAAFGTSNGYRAMTVAEARDNRDQFDTAQWQPAVDAIECLQLGPSVTVTGGGAITEGGDAAFTVTAAPAPAADLEVKLTVADDTASDFLDDSDERTHTVTILAGRNAADLAVSTEDDGKEEADGSVSAVVASGAGYRIGSPGAATVAVSDDDDPAPSTPVVSIAGGSGITEGGAAGFTLTAAPAPTGDITVEVAVTDSGSFAASGQTGTQTVTIGATGTAALTVATENDSTEEANGTIAATLQAGTGYTVAASPDDAASVAVEDDDAAAVPKGPSLSVNDVTVQEGPYRRVTFTVTLSEASDRYVSFSWRVRESDPVSAKRGVDFWASTSKQFAGMRPGQIEYRIRAGMVVDDSHDEDPETFEIVLSDAFDAAIADGVGVATIINNDPMPAAWLSRFGRTVAEQALDGIANRMAAPRTAGVEGSFAGQAMSFAPGSGSGTGGPTGGFGAAHDRGLTEPAGSGDPEAVAVGSQSGTGPGYPEQAMSGTRGSGFGDDNAGSAYAMTMRDIMLGSSFTLTGAEDSRGGSLAFWGRAAQSFFDGREGALSLDGEATTAMLGADYATDRWLIGMALMQSRGEGGYADTGIDSRPASQSCDGMDEQTEVLCRGAVREGDGKVEAALTAALPYASLRASERLEFWGALGHGTGDVTLKPARGRALKADISWSMAAMGMRGDLLPPPAEGGGPALTLVSDALWARTSSDRTQDLAASESDVTRLRLGLEGRWHIALPGASGSPYGAEGAGMTPRLEVGMRHDGGDAETGFGVELGGGIAWSDPALGLNLDLSGRTLVAHGSDDLEDRGFAASLGFDPEPASARGLSLSLRQDWGGSAAGGLDALFTPDPLGERGGFGEATARWHAEAAYGLPALGGRFTGSPHVGLGLATGARDYTLGWRLSPAGNAPDLSFGMRVTRSESDSAPPAYTVGGEFNARW